MYLAPQGFCPELQSKQSCCKQEQPEAASLIPGPASEPTAHWIRLMQTAYVDLEHRNYVLATATAISYGTSSVAATDILLNEMHSKREGSYFPLPLSGTCLLQKHIVPHSFLAHALTGKEHSLFLDFLHMLARLSRKTCLGKQGNTVWNRLDL